MDPIIMAIFTSVKNALVQERNNVLGTFCENDLRKLAAWLFEKRKNEKPFLQTLILDILYNPRYRRTAPNGTTAPQQQPLIATQPSVQRQQPFPGGTATPQQLHPVNTLPNVQQQQVPPPPQPFPGGTATPQQQRQAPFWSDSLRKYISVQEQQHPLMHPDVHGRYPELPAHLNSEQRQKMQKYRLAIAQHRVHQQQQHAPNIHTPGMQQMPLQHHQQTLPQLNTPAIVPEALVKPTGQTNPTPSRIESHLTYRDHAAHIQKTRMEREAKQALVDRRPEPGLRSLATRKPGEVFSYPAKRLSLFSNPEDWKAYDEDRSADQDKQTERKERANKVGEWIQALGNQQTESEARSHAPVMLPRTPPSQRVNRKPSLTPSLAPAASNETVTARPRRLSSFSSFVFGEPKERKKQCDDAGSQEDVKHSISPPLSLVPDQNGGTTKRKLSISDLGAITLSPCSKRQRKEGSDVAEKGDDRIPIVKMEEESGED
jgi:hypothetical protein